MSLSAADMARHRSDEATAGSARHSRKCCVTWSRGPRGPLRPSRSSLRLFVWPIQRQFLL